MRKPTGKHISHQHRNMIASTLVTQVEGNIELIYTPKINPETTKEELMNIWKKTVLLTLALGMFATAAEARKDIEDYSIKDALLQSDKGKVRKDIPLYFGSQRHPAVKKSFGEFSTNKKTNAFMKEDKEACNWAFLSALVQLQERAAKLGGNAVINIKSNYDRHETSSTSTFKCAAGNVIAGVALKGTIVKIK